METGLPEVRAQIDAVDDELLALLRRRAGLTVAAGKIKQAAGAQTFARPDREADILRRLAPGGGALAESSVRTIFGEIISACLAVEAPQTVCYLGPPRFHRRQHSRRYHRRRNFQLRRRPSSTSRQIVFSIRGCHRADAASSRGVYLRVWKNGDHCSLRMLPPAYNRGHKH